MTYLEEAAEQLRRARSANEARAGSVNSWLTEGAVPVLTEVNQRRMEIADGFIRLAAIERAQVPAEGALAPEPDARIAKALGYAPDGMYDGDHHKRWVLDQMVRALTGCPVVTKTATDVNGREYSYDAQGESGAYLRFVHDAGEWDEGIAPLWRST